MIENIDVTQQELIATWTSGDLVYKLFLIDREAIDEGVDDENDVYDLIGIDSGNVRRVAERFDDAYGRDYAQPGQDDRIDVAITEAPIVAQNVMYNYGWGR